MFLLPDRVVDVAIWINEKHGVGLGHPLEFTCLGVGEVEVGCPKKNEHVLDNEMFKRIIRVTIYDGRFSL